MGNVEQIFKSDPSEWFRFWSAYSKEGMKKAPSRYMKVHSLMVDANKAIEEAGIEGVNKISENPNPDMVFRFATRRQKLEDFAHKVHVDVCTLIDDPFCERMAELSTSVRAHTEFKVNYNGQEYSIDVDDVSVESINRLFIDLIDPEYRDSQFVTGDKTVDNYIKEYSEFDPSNKKYGFEIALENWENLNPDQQEALRHLYEYYFRRVEENIDPDTAEAKGAQYILDKMTMHLDETPLNPNGAAKGLLSLMKKEHCHSYKMLEAIVDDKSFMIGAGMKINEKTTEDGFMNNWEEKTLSPTLCYEYDKAGIKLVRTFKDDKGWGIGIGSKEIAYYTSPQRCVDYVNYQEKKTPGCYNHMKELGYDEVMIASMLLASENTYDMQVFDNLTKSDGDYSKVFTVDARCLSDDAKKIIFSHTASMQSLYAALSEEKQNLGSSEQYRNTPEQYREKSFGALDKKIKLFKNELDGINSFYADSENSLASGYFDSYIEFSKQYMTQEQKVSLYSTPGYKLSDEELAEAKVLYKKELDSFQYHGKDQPIFKNPGDDIRYKNAVILKHKCSKVQSAFAGAEKAMADAGGAVLDLAVLDLSAKAYMATSVIDYVAGTDTKSYVSKFNEGYHELGDYFMAGINEDVQNVVTQNPEAYYVGNIGMKFLIYQAVSPVFESASKGLGVTSKAGKFFINQAGQDTLDTWLYTYPKYKELIADGELSTDDKIELGIDVGVNALLNLAFGGIEVAVDNKVTKDLVDEFRASDDINKFSKGLKDKDIKRLVESLEPDETEKLVKGLSGTNSSAKKVSREAQLYKEQGQIDTTPKTSYGKSSVGAKKYSDYQWYENEVDVTQTAGRSKNKISPNSNATGNHVVYKKDPVSGEITNYKVYIVNPKNPSGFDEVIGYDGIGSPHTNPTTLEDLMPHVHDKTVPGKVRAPYPDEIPGH